ncbi:MAG: hypothetical protein ABF593_08860 [Acetobacter papayae]|uniref:hypothetical protein n=1 Tax=Acetobacter papayae TaxID=1076592 RepID=UPI0039ED6E94
MTDNPLKKIIPSSAPKEAEDGNPQEKRDVDILYGYIASLEAGKKEYDEKRQKYKERKRNLKLARVRLDLRMKNKFSKNVFKYLWFYSGFCALVVLLQGFNPDVDVHSFHLQLWNVEFRLKRFNLDNKVLITLVGATAASAIGLVAIVLKGLFSSSDNDKKPDDKKKDGS